MKSIVFILFSLLLIRISNAQNLFVADTFTYTINLDLSKNLYLKTVPVDLLKGYCKGEWNAYYPKREMNQCLFDDFLQRFNAYQVNTSSSTCSDDYCGNSYFTDLYNQFGRKLKYKEVIYFDQQHAVVKREVLWLQVFYSRKENYTWKHYEGPVFWLKEIKSSTKGISVYNKEFRADAWALEKEFNHAGFITNEYKQKDDTKKIQKINQTEEY